MQQNKNKDSEKGREGGCKYFNNFQLDGRNLEKGARFLVSTRF